MTHEKDPKSLKNVRGQSLFEFILLFLVIVTISVGVIKGINGGLAKYWLNMAKIIIEDPAQKLTLR